MLDCDSDNDLRVIQFTPPETETAFISAADLGGAFRLARYTHGSHVVRNSGQRGVKRRESSCIKHFARSALVCPAKAGVTTVKGECQITIVGGEPSSCWSFLQIMPTRAATRRTVRTHESFPLGGNDDNSSLESARQRSRAWICSCRSRRRSPYGYPSGGRGQLCGNSGFHHREAGHAGSTRVVVLAERRSAAVVCNHAARRPAHRTGRQATRRCVLRRHRGGRGAVPRGYVNTDRRREGRTAPFA